MFKTLKLKQFLRSSIIRLAATFLSFGVQVSLISSDFWILAGYIRMRTWAVFFFGAMVTSLSSNV